MPLADTLRPNRLVDFIGQEHLIGENAPISKLVETQNLVSMILCWIVIFIQFLP
jgi:putative ATPase